MIDGNSCGAVAESCVADVDPPVRLAVTGLGASTRRVPVDVVIVMLTQSGIPANARTIRNWRLRGHITRTRDGYDVFEVVEYLAKRGIVPDTPVRAA